MGLPDGFWCFAGDRLVSVAGLACGAGLSRRRGGRLFRGRCRGCRGGGVFWCGRGVAWPEDHADDDADDQDHHQPAGDPPSQALSARVIGVLVLGHEGPPSLGVLVALDEDAHDRSGAGGQSADDDRDGQSLDALDLASGEGGEHQGAGRSEEAGYADDDDDPADPVQQGRDALGAWRLLGGRVRDDAGEGRGGGHQVHQHGRSPYLGVRKAWMILVSLRGSRPGSGGRCRQASIHGR
ncbi:hypothetical protein ACFFX0_32635 [Citricoccus parietis]|uniref:Uncharacterized protein n=1 Tax=Citricoccus parietis TaxID=592307 RepID=A0ABV5GB19_9MICC